MIAKCVAPSRRQLCLPASVRVILAMVFAASSTATCEPRCSDGSPALIQCVPLARRNPLRVEFVCTAQSSFICEPLGDVFYCCAPTVGLPPTLALAHDWHVDDFVTTTPITTTTIGVSNKFASIQPQTTTKITTVQMTTATHRPIQRVDAAVAAFDDNAAEEAASAEMVDSPAVECVDRNSQCAFVNALCVDRNHQRMLADQCAKTCGLCGVGGGGSSASGGAICADRGKDCQRAQFLCNLKVSSALMSRECAMTCGKCPDASVQRRSSGGAKSLSQEGKNSGGDESPCRDNYRRCATWKMSGFCTTIAYPQSIKRKFCARTCNFC